MDTWDGQKVKLHMMYVLVPCTRDSFSLKKMRFRFMIFVSEIWRFSALVFDSVILSRVFYRRSYQERSGAKHYVAS